MPDIHKDTQFGIGYLSRTRMECALRLHSDKTAHVTNGNNWRPQQVPYLHQMDGVFPSSSRFPKCTFKLKMVLSPPRLSSSSIFFCTNNRPTTGQHIGTRTQMDDPRKSRDLLVSRTFPKLVQMKPAGRERGHHKSTIDLQELEQFAKSEQGI